MMPKFYVFCPRRQVLFPPDIVPLCHSALCYFQTRQSVFELTLCWNVQNVVGHKSEAADTADSPVEHTSKARWQTFWL